MIRPRYALCAAARGLRATVAATTARPRSSARLRSAVFRLAVQFGSRPACLYNKSCCCVPKIRVSILYRLLVGYLFDGFVAFLRLGLESLPPPPLLHRRFRVSLFRHLLFDVLSIG